MRTRAHAWSTSLGTDDGRWTMSAERWTLDKGPWLLNAACRLIDNGRWPLGHLIYQDTTRHDKGEYEAS